MAWVSKRTFPERAASNMRCAKSSVSGGSDEVDVIVRVERDDLCNS